MFERLITTLAISLAETATSSLVANPESLTNEELAVLVKQAAKSVDDAFAVTHAITYVLEKRFCESRDSGKLDLSYWKEITQQSGEWATGLRMVVIREDMKKSDAIKEEL